VELVTGQTSHESREVALHILLKRLSLNLRESSSLLSRPQKLWKTLFNPESKAKRPLHSTSTDILLGSTSMSVRSQARRSSLQGTRMARSQYVLWEKSECEMAVDLCHEADSRAQPCSARASQLQGQSTSVPQPPTSYCSGPSKRVIKQWKAATGAPHPHPTL